MTNRKATIEQILTEFQKVKQRIFSENQHTWQSCNLTPAQGHLLFLVKKNSGITVSEIAKKLNVSNSAITQLINGLAKEGFLERKPDPSDHRVVKLELTSKTCDQISEIRAKSVKKLSSVFSKLDDTELTMFAKIIKKISSGEGGND